MRLLNTTTFRVEEFLTNIPRYAILSHTWEKYEISFQDIQDLHEAKKKVDLEVEEAKKRAEFSKVLNIQKKAGWLKIWKSCEYVRQYKFKWIWIDTCCIDKSSSAELSEALNSMYKYYGESRICIAYLSDVSMKIQKEANRKEVIWKDIMKSEDTSIRWFTRGWTLQELIAPRYMVFLDKGWDKIGTRFGLRHVLSEVTSIPVEVFEAGRLDDYSIAQKMSWAASRKTTREEDMAYCLMGLFGVNMPPIYGEGGAKAFMRLQQEIIRYSDDRSIFAWVSQHYHQERGMFASSPSEFALSGKIGKSNGLGDKSSFSFGNNGLRIHLSLQHSPKSGEDIFYASLHCQDPNGVIGIYLQKKEDHYVRWRPYFSLSHTDGPLETLPESLLKSLQEVVVRESAVPQQQVKHHTIFRVEFNLDSDVSFIDDDTYQPQYVHLTSDTYKLRTKEGNVFDVELWPDDVFLRMRIRILNQSFDRDDHFLQDSGLLPVDDENAVVSCYIHTTGESQFSDKRIVEINYIPSSSAKFQLYRQICEFRCPSHAPTLTTLNLTFDIRTLSCYLSAPSVVPFEYRWVEGVRDPMALHGDAKGAYMSISYQGEQRDMHWVFQYPLWHKDGCVFVALGLLNESERRIPWVDVFASTETLSISDVWESYLFSGSRYKDRKDGTATTPKCGWHWGFKVTAEKKMLLGSAWYHVKINEL